MLPKLDFDEQIDEKNNEMTSARKSFVEMVDRGGLVYPSELVYTVTLMAVKLKEEIFGDVDIKKKFLQFEDPRSVFVFCLEKRALASDKMYEVLNQICQKGHTFHTLVPEIAKRTFNFMAKNFITAINDNIHENRKRKSSGKKDSGARKIAKLSSNSGM